MLVMTTKTVPTDPYHSGSGALGAMEGLRAGGYTGHMTVISREGMQPIDRTKLSKACLLYTSPSPRDGLLSRMPSSA